RGTDHPRRQATPARPGGLRGLGGVLWRSKKPRHERGGPMIRALPALSFVCLVGCGSAVCGNGKVEDGEQCDDGNNDDGDGCSSDCRSVPTIDTFVSWRLIESEWPDHGESCGDVGASRARLDVTGPKAVSQTVDCTFYQFKLSSLPLGNYTAAVTLLDG